MRDIIQGLLVAKDGLILIAVLIVVLMETGPNASFTTWTPIDMLGVGLLLGILGIATIVNLIYITHERS